MNESVFVALIGAFSALLGTIIGAVLSYYFNVRKMYKNKNADYCMRIFGIYNSAATEIISLLSPMVSLSLHTKTISIEQICEWKKSLSDIYFKYYIYLPQDVLNEINCLHSCLQTNGKRIFYVQNKYNIKPCGKSEAIALFEDTALVGGEKDKIENIIKKYSIEQCKTSLKINLQARRVIRILAQNFEDKTIDSWDAILKKETILQVKSKK